MKPRDPTTPEELQRMLDAGMGRAILFLVSRDQPQYRDMILDSCLHNRAYDPQCEDTRAEYLYPLIKESGEEDFYRQEILGGLARAKDWQDVEQLLDFAVLFARGGSEGARKAIYGKLLRNGTDQPLVGADAVIELDRVSGLIFLLDFIGRVPEPPDEDGHRILTDSELLVEKTEKKVGVEEVRLALQRAASENPDVAAALDNMPNYSPNWTAEEIIERREGTRQNPMQVHRDRAACMSWDELKSSPAFRELVVAWARQVSDEEFEKASADLSAERDTERLKHHLRMFWKRPFPFDPHPLIRLIDHPDDLVVIRALNALELIKHPDVRALSLRLREHPKWSERAIGLLRNNYQQGDDAVILGMLEAETDLDRLHGMSHGTMDVYKDNPLPEGMEPLLMVYEKNPCSTCRHTCIETIEMIGGLPEWMVEESLYDADSCTRQLAQEIKQGTRKLPMPKWFSRA